ncbi:hypothetical protein [Eubacterium sp.]|uniref:hypothetical protein n=1 Tax=Eubacterium sp. TaxID=142586 RepID=UPI0025902EB0|nr:hypothetical protein [Eubacterium sp.]MCR5368476.1 hypothetical protein [Eubacterium sp.]
MTRGFKKFAAGMMILALGMSSLAACGKKKDNNNTENTASTATPSEATTTEEKIDLTPIYTEEQAHALEVMKVGDEVIHFDTMMIYLIMAYNSYQVTEDAIPTLKEMTKRQTVSNIREAWSIYKVLTEENFEVSTDDLNQARQYAEAFISSGHDVLKKYGVSNDTVIAEFERQMKVEKYKLAKKDEMVKAKAEEVSKEYNDKRFYKLYTIVFPIVEVDEKNQPKVNAKGEFATLSDADKVNMKEQAEKARQEIIDGANYLQVVNKYGVDKYSDACSSYEGFGLQNGGTDTFDHLKNGDVTDISENEVGYFFYVMTNDNDEELKKEYITYLSDNAVSSDYNKNLKEWKNSIPVDDEKDIIGTTWEDFDTGAVGEDLLKIGFFSVQK